MCVYFPSTNVYENTLNGRLLFNSVLTVLVVFMLSCRTFNFNHGKRKVDKRTRQTNEWCVSQIVRWIKLWYQQILQRPHLFFKTTFYYFRNLSIFDRMTEQMTHSFHFTWKSAKSEENKRKLHSNKIDKYIERKQKIAHHQHTLKC